MIYYLAIEDWCPTRLATNGVSVVRQPGSTIDANVIFRCDDGLRFADMTTQSSHVCQQNRQWYPNVLVCKG